MGNKSSSNRIRLGDWKFQDNEIVKLLWVGDPYLSNSKWKSDIYFKSLDNHNIEVQTVDWGTVAILKIGELYQNGREIKDKRYIDTEYIKSYHYYTDSFSIDGSKITLRRTRHKFGFIKSFVYIDNNIEIRIPVFEILRSIIARNKRLLYAVLEPDSLHNYFEWQEFSDKFVLKSKGKYPKSLLRDKRHTYYLSWLLSDKYAYSSWNDIYENIILKGLGLEFQFPCNDMITIDARYYRPFSNVVRVEQINKVSGIILPYDEIELIGVEKYRSKSTKKPKKHIVIERPIEIEIDTTKGAKRSIDIVKTSIAKMDKPLDIKVSFTDTKQYNVNSSIDDSTNFIYIQDDRARSMGDVLTDSNEKSIELQEDDDKTMTSDFNTFIMVFRELINRYGFDINYKIGNLPPTDKDKKFRYIDDSNRIRMFLFATIIINDKVLYFLDIERDGKSLSTLVLHNRDYDIIDDIEDILNSIMKSLINSSGSWNNGDIIGRDIIENRIRHFNGKNLDVISRKYYRRFIIV